MTWGASLMRLPDDMTIAEMEIEFGSDWQVPSVGTLSEVRDGLVALFPDADHIDGQTNLEDGYARVQFNYTDRTGNGIIESIGINSNGDTESIPVIRLVCKKFGLRMVDHQSGEVADFSSGTMKSMADYSAFRDRNWKPPE
jgi:hypothetical protein